MNVSKLTAVVVEASPDLFLVSCDGSGKYNGQCSVCNVWLTDERELLMELQLRNATEPERPKARVLKS
tara:strand:+ start:7653 stop:7856 length:204 start_codon:yes stop_codon:yes gene_type:complete